MSDIGYCYDQQDPAQCCADRPLVTSEIHTPNDFYGQASVLKRYAGLPQWYSLKGVLEHGIALSDKMWELDRDARVPMIFCPSTWRAEVVQLLSGKPAVPIGFGFLYAMRLVEAAAPRRPRASGTIAFPCHSTHTIDALFDREKYARRLVNLPRAMQPVTVCLYWKNYLQGDHRFYEQQGLPVVSAGHMFDRDFLPRLYDLLRRFRFATSNAVGTHLMLAVSAGCRFFYTNADSVDWSVPAAERGNIDSANSLFKQREQHSWELFHEPVDEVTPRQREFVDELIGTRHCLDPVSLRRLLLRSELADKLGTKDRRPPFVQRRLARLAKIRNSVRKRLPRKRQAA